jgi:hypothetical protein
MKRALLLPLAAVAALLARQRDHPAHALRGREPRPLRARPGHRLVVC